MHSRIPLLLTAVLAGCSPRITTIGENVDAGPPATATVTGRVCTSAPDPAGFPVKLVVLLDQSGSSCVIDPPGVQASPGFCEMVAMTPPGVTQPARVRALNRLLDRVEQLPNVEVALVPFETNVKGEWPAAGSGQRFARPDANLRFRVNTLQAELGKASDYQGALAYAYGLIASDMNSVSMSNPALLPRSRYVVLLVSDGPPNPRCAANDNLARYADDLRPVGLWADTQPSFCNTIDPQDPDAIIGFIAGTDRNQDPTLYNIVDELLEERAALRVGDLRVHTVLLSNPDALAACGPLCQDLFGLKLRWPGPVPAPSASDYAHVEALTLLSGLAARGGGTFTEFSNTAGLAGANYDAVDLRGLSSVNVQRELLAQPLRATPVNGVWAADDDGDGASNEAELAAGTNPTAADTDGDGFSDLFELERASLSFNPLVKDLRGCDPVSPMTPGCAVRDPDGDGLSQYEESFLNTSSTLVDSDADGFPDGLEVRFGLSPTITLDPNADSDGDGVTDANELRRGSHPRQADAALPGITFTSTPVPQPDSRQCYDFTVSGLPMVTGASTAVPPGVGLFRLWFAEAPETVVGLDYGVWRAACFFTRRDATQSPAILVPPGLRTTLFETSFVSPQNLLPLTTQVCTGADALTP